MRKIIPVVAAGATALALASGSFAYATLDKDVTLSVDGATTEVNTFSSTVGDVLKKQGIRVSDRDIVAPAVDAKITDGTRIAVQFGREVKVNIDGKEKSFWTTATRVDQALAALNLNTTGAELSTSRSSSIGREGLALDIATLKSVRVNVAGKKRVLRTNAQTVGELLSELKVEVDSNDILSARPTATLTNGGSFRYTRVDVKKSTKKKKVGFDTVQKSTKKLNKGVTKVDTEGKKGVRTLTYKVVRHNGKVTSKKKINSEVTKKPRTEVVLVGTKVVQQKSSNSSSDSPHVASGSVWDRLAQCESGGNWSINTGNGFYGGLQFTASTWHAYGGSGMPHHASREQQIAIAKKVQAGQGWGAWPACTSKLGIR